MGREQREGGDGGAKVRGRRRGKRRGHFTDGYDGNAWVDIGYRIELQTDAWGDRGYGVH